MEQSNKSKTIIKVIICFGAFAVFGVVALIVTAVLIFQSVTSPAHIKAVAANFMTLADPLPKGFTYTAAYEVAGLPIVQITDEDQQNLYTFTSTGDPSKEQVENFADSTDVDRVAAPLSKFQNRKIHLSMGAKG